jgi:hypothetical protein
LASFDAENGTSRPKFRVCAKYATVSIIVMPMMIPGMTPARNSCPIETLAIIP